MGAVGLLAASQIRRRWRSTLAIILLIGVVGAVVLATAAGARRSDSALPRFNAESRSSDLEISVGQPTAKQLAGFAKTPGVETIAHLRAYAFDTSGDRDLAELAIAAPLSSVMGNQVDRARLITGRRADPKVPEEITIDESLASLFHLGVGDSFQTGSFSADQVRVAFSGGNPGNVGEGPKVKFRVVGIVRRPLDLGVRATAGGVIVLSPTFAPKYDSRLGAYTDVLRVRTVHGQADVPRVSAAARKIFGKAYTFQIQGLSIETEGARNAIDVLTLALWIIAGVTALAGLVAISIVLSRDIAHSDLDQATLRGLGLSRRQRILVNGPRAALIAAGATVLAVILGIALSPLFPIGVARRADPDPGLHADWLVLIAAVAAIALVVLLIALLATLRATRRSSYERAANEYGRTSTIVERAAAAGLRPTATNGLRMAIQSGRGEVRVPVLSSFVGVVFGIAGVTAALVFAASLSHLVASPRIYGWDFDVSNEVGALKGPCADTIDHGLARQPGVIAVAHLCPADVQIDGRPATGWGFQSLSGTVDPIVVEGRAPRGPHETALGQVTLDALHKGIGDTVKVRGAGKPRRYRVVGRIILPTVGAPQALADGAAFTGAGWSPLYESGGNETNFLVARVQPGARAAIEARLGAISRAKGAVVATPPVEVERLQQIDRIPVSLAALLGVLALLAVGYALVTGVRRRRHELAVLKILGFSRGQVRSTVAWQATILGVVGLVLGIPIGIVVGRQIWQLVADGLGISTVVTIPTIWLIAAVPVTLALVNLIAYFPGRSAAKTVPAVALRTE
jgi:FtsX-like permease family